MNSESSGPWPASKLLAYIREFTHRYRVVDLKSALTRIGARNTSQLSKQRLHERLLQELTDLQELPTFRESVARALGLDPLPDGLPACLQNISRHASAAPLAPTVNTSNDMMRSLQALAPLVSARPAPTSSAVSALPGQAAGITSGRHQPSISGTSSVGVVQGVTRPQVELGAAGSHPHGATLNLPWALAGPQASPPVPAAATIRHAVDGTARPPPPLRPQAGVISAPQSTAFPPAPTRVANHGAALPPAPARVPTSSPSHAPALTTAASPPSTIELARRSGVLIQWPRVSLASSAYGRFPRRACVCGGIVWPWGPSAGHNGSSIAVSAAPTITAAPRAINASSATSTATLASAAGSAAATSTPSSTLTCTTPGCGAVYHTAHVGVTRLLPRGTRWRCVLCRSAAAMPHHEVEALLTPPKSLRARDGGSVRLEWDSHTLNHQEAGRCVRMLCLVGSESASTCQWPISATLTVNGLQIAVPRSAPDARSAPLLDVTSVVGRGINSVILSAPPSPESAVYICVLVIVRPIDRAGLVNTVLNARTLPLPLAESCVRAALCPRQMVDGVVVSPTADIASAWSRMQNARTFGGSATLEVTEGSNAHVSSSHAMLPALPTNVVETISASAAASSAGGGPNTGASDVDDIDDEVAVPYIVISLRDPNTRAPIRLPVRGDACEHVQPFDLVPFLTLNSGPTAKWKCPVCNKITMPSTLWFDAVIFAGVLVPLSQGLTTGHWAESDEETELKHATNADSTTMAPIAAAGADAPLLQRPVAVTGPKPSARAASALATLVSLRYSSRSPPMSHTCCVCMRAVPHRKLLVPTANGSKLAAQQHCAACGAPYATALQTTAISHVASAATSPTMALQLPAGGSAHDSPNVSLGARTGGSSSGGMAPHEVAAAGHSIVRHCQPDFNLNLPPLAIVYAAVSSAMLLPLSTLAFLLPMTLDASHANAAVSAPPKSPVALWHAHPHEFGRHAALIGAPLPLGDGIALRPSVSWTTADAPSSTAAPSSSASPSSAVIGHSASAASVAPTAAARAATTSMSRRSYCGPMLIPDTGVTIDIGDDSDVRPITVELLRNGTWRLVAPRSGGVPARQRSDDSDDTSASPVPPLAKRQRVSVDTQTSSGRGDATADAQITLRMPVPDVRLEPPAASNWRPQVEPRSSDGAGVVESTDADGDSDVVDLTAESPPRAVASVSNTFHPQAAAAARPTDVPAVASAIAIRLVP